VLAVVFGVIMYRVILLSILFVSRDEIVNKFAKIVTSATAAFINLVAIIILNRVSCHYSYSLVFCNMSDMSQFLGALNWRNTINMLVNVKANSAIEYLCV